MLLFFKHTHNRLKDLLTLFINSCYKIKYTFDSDNIFFVHVYILAKMAGESELCCCDYYGCCYIIYLCREEEGKKRNVKEVMANMSTRI